jgi:hypothetical protein
VSKLTHDAAIIFKAPKIIFKIQLFVCKKKLLLLEAFNISNYPIIKNSGAEIKMASFEIGKFPKCNQPPV